MQATNRTSPAVCRKEGSIFKPLQYVRPRLSNAPAPPPRRRTRFRLLGARPLRLAGAAFAPLTSARMPQAAAAVAAAGATLLAGHAQVNAAGDTLYDKVAALAAAVDALEQKAGGAGDLK